MPEYILRVNHHTVEEVSIEAQSPEEAIEKAYQWEWEGKDVIKVVSGEVDFVMLCDDGKEEVPPMTPTQSFTEWARHTQDFPGDS